MAESVQTSCASPKLKRPRLDNEDGMALPLSPYDTKFDRCLVRNEDRRFAVPYEVSSTSDPQSDTYGGDSGFHELTPPVSTEYIDSTSVDGLNLDIVYDQHIDFVNGIHIPEADSSQADILGEPSNSIYPAVDDLSCLVPDDGDNEADEVASTISDISGLSDLSDFSGQDWKPTAGPVSWVQRQMNLGADPRSILLELVPKGTIIPYHLDEVTLWKIVVNMLSEPPRRKKLTNVNTLDDVIQLLKTCNRIIVLTGAGVSVSCGIPDFRSRNGIYARLSKDYPDLPDPQAMFDINYFKKDPRPFFKFAKEIYPGQFQPSPSHHFICLLEKHNKLLRNYTQNIDTLEQAAGIQRVITCHGSFATASCTSCGYKVGCSEIKDDIFTQCIPYCPYCPSDQEEMAVMKPDIVFFGEGLSDEFHQTMAKDKDICDLLIVIGSSLKVRPVALIPSSIPPDVPQILINREPLKHLTFDVELLGDCDIIITELCNRLGGDWLHIAGARQSLCQITELSNYKSSLNVSADSEVNNNNDAIQADTTTVNVANRLGNWSSNVVPTSVEEESCSCDCNNLSNIRIEDSLDSTVEPELKSSPDSTCNDNMKPRSTKEPDTRQPSCWEPKNKQSVSSKLPENTFLYVPPSRYIFHGAEVYSDSNMDKCQGEQSEVSSSSADEEENADAKEATSSGIHIGEDPLEIGLCLGHSESLESAVEGDICESIKRIESSDGVSLSCS